MRAKKWSGPSGRPSAPKGECTKHTFLNAFLLFVFFGMHLMAAPGVRFIFEISKTTLVLYICLTPSLALCWTFQRSIPHQKTSTTLHGNAPAQNGTSATLHGNVFRIFMIQLYAPKQVSQKCPRLLFLNVFVCIC
jgi:hypothetical protein